MGVPAGVRVFCLIVLSNQAVAVLAQQPSTQKPSSTGSVSGHVYCADTNKPARMATVALVSANTVDSDKTVGPISTYAETVQTLLDGSYTIHQVAPGAYYVVAMQSGYLSALVSAGISEEDLQKPSDAVKKRIANVTSQISIQPNASAQMDIVLNRGAAVNGRVLFDDGSPAPGLEVRLLVRRNGQWVPMQSGPFGELPPTTRTDDRGNYRISGLPKQQYLLEVELQLEKTAYTLDGMGGHGTAGYGAYSIPIYAGGNARPKDGSPFSLTLGEERSGQDLYIPISKLHSVTGAIASAHDGHIVNGGTMSLLRAVDRSEATHTDLSDASNEFTFTFVPEGDYILHIDNASDNEYEQVPNPPGSIPPTRTNTHVLHRYEAADQPVHVDGDLSGIVVSVTESPSKIPHAIP
jgi:hypothetical protein